MQTYTARLKRDLEAVGYRFERGDLWECYTGPDDTPEFVGSSHSLGELVNQTADALGGCDE